MRNYKMLYLTGILFVALGTVQLLLAGRMGRVPSGPTQAQWEELIAAHARESQALKKTIALKDEMIKLLQSKPVGYEFNPQGKSE
jgi:hypothetical protein